MSNQITITGNLTADPELRFTPSGTAVTNFTIADTPRRFNRDSNQWEDAGDTLFLRCTVWDRLAVTAGEALKKGDRVTATGMLTQRSYDTRDGEKRTVIEARITTLAQPLRTTDTAAPATPAMTETGGDPWATTAPF